MNLPQQNIVTTTKTNLMQTVSVVNNSTMPLSNAMDPLFELYEDLQQSKQVRMGVNEVDGKPFVSVYDFINFITGRDRTNGYGQVTFHNMSKYSNELKSLTFEHEFVGKYKNHKTPCVNITGIFQLISILVNKFSAKYRSWATQLQQRYIAGDPVLVCELRKNFNSDHPLNQLARLSLVNEEMPTGQVSKFSIKNKTFKNKKFKNKAFNKKTFAKKPWKKTYWKRRSALTVLKKPNTNIHTAFVRGRLSTSLMGVV